MLGRCGFFFLRGPWFRGPDISPQNLTISTHGDMCRYEESLEGFQRAVKLLEEAGAHALQIAQAEHQMGVALERLGQVHAKVFLFCM